MNPIYPTSPANTFVDYNANTIPDVSVKTSAFSAKPDKITSSQTASSTKQLEALSKQVKLAKANRRGSSPSISSLQKNTKKILTPDAQGNIHEEELQHALVFHLLEPLGQGVQSAYLRFFGKVIGTGIPPLSAEDATKLSLQNLVSSGLISKTKAEEVNGASFYAAQLDDNPDALYDNRGSERDLTIATMPIDRAIEKADSALKALGIQPSEQLNRPLDIPSNSVPQELNSGSLKSTTYRDFLWKPSSESDGRLVVLLPAELRGEVSSLELYRDLPASSQTLIEVGRFSGDIHNGGRPHFRFQKPGSAYPDTLYAVALMRDGGTIEIPIHDSSRRQEGV